MKVLQFLIFGVIFVLKKHRNFYTLTLWLWSKNLASATVCKAVIGHNLSESWKDSYLLLTNRVKVWVVSNWMVWTWMRILGFSFLFFFCVPDVQYKFAAGFKFSSDISVWRSSSATFSETVHKMSLFQSLHYLFAYRRVYFDAKYLDGRCFCLCWCWQMVERTEAQN